MNAEALLVIGIATVVLSLPLLLIGWLVARFYHRRHPNTEATRRITKAGALLFGSMTAFWVAGLIWAIGHPSGWVGALLSAGGIQAFVFVTGIPFILAGVFLEARGVKFLSKASTIVPNSAPHGDGREASRNHQPSSTSVRGRER